MNKKTNDKMLCLKINYSITDSIGLRSAVRKAKGLTTVKSSIYTKKKTKTYAEVEVLTRVQAEVALQH